MKPFVAAYALLAATLAGALACTRPAETPTAEVAEETTAVADAAAEPESLGIDPAAIEAVQRMTRHLGTLTTFQIAARSTVEEVADDGQKLQFEGAVTYKVRRPDAFFIDARTDRRIREFYYNGKTFTMFAPRMHVFTEVEAPPTILEMVGVLEEKYDVHLPLTDLFRWGSEPDDIEALTSAQYVGPARVDGVECDHYAFRQAVVDWQIWIQRGDAPLPRKLVITSRDNPSFPQYAAILDWKTDLSFDPGVFNFRKPADTLKIALAEVSDTTP
jgi:hypothetical protein